MAEGVVNLGDNSIKSQGGDFEKTPVRRIKMKKGEKIRITFLSDEVISRLRHYYKGVGYRRCLSYQGFCPGCIAADKDSEFAKDKSGKSFKRASESFGANVFVYDTDPTLQQLSEKIGSIYLFVFGTEKFSQLRTIKQMYGSLVGLDLMVECIDGDFQKMTITPYPQQNSFCNIEQIRSTIDKAFKSDSYPLEKMIAKEVTPAQMIKDFGLNPAIMNLPEAKSFQEIAESTDSVASKQFFDPSSMQKSSSTPQAVQSSAQGVSAHKSEVRSIDTASLLDEL